MIGVMLPALWVAGLVGTLPDAAPTQGQYRRTMRGYSGSSNEFRLTGGNLLMHEGTPGVLFGTVRAPGAKERFSYVVIFKHAPGPGGTDEFTHRGDCSTSGNSGSTACSIIHNGKQVSADYRATADQADGALSETLRLGGEQVDPASGRVFLVDLTAPTPVYKQLKIDQPAAVGTLETPQDVERLAKRLLKRLSPQIPDNYRK